MQSMNINGWSTPRPTAQLNSFPEPQKIPLKPFFSILSNVLNSKLEGNARRDLELGYRYPGPPVNHPKNITELELFLERYNRFN